MSVPVIEIKDLTYAFNGRIVLQGINLTVAQGDFMAMIGPNGSGKTTLIKLMLGLLPLQQGSVRIQDRSPAEASHRVGYVPQNTNINIHFPISALDVVLMGQLKPGGRRMRQRQKDRDAAHEALNDMGMGSYCRRRMGELSGGQRQRVFIARALVSQPEILLLDEPAAHLDTKGQADLYALLSRLNREITIVVVSHDLLVLSTHVKSVACVNRQLHYHSRNDLLGHGPESQFPCTAEEVCPVALVAYGVPSNLSKTCKG